MESFFKYIIILILKFILAFLTPETNILPRDGATFGQTFKQGLFSVGDCHYLKVPSVETSTAYDDFECILKCMRNPMCFSVNLAAFKGADGKLWCELLSSDKYRNFIEYKRSKTSHHFAFMVRSEYKNKLKPVDANNLFFLL